jgi:hypothetical protein
MNIACCYCVSPCKKFELLDPFEKLLKRLTLFSLTVKYNIIFNDYKISVKCGQL